MNRARKGVPSRSSTLQGTGYRNQQKRREKIDLKCEEWKKDEEETRKRKEKRMKMEKEDGGWKRRSLCGRKEEGKKKSGRREGKGRIWPHERLADRRLAGWFEVIGWFRYASVMWFDFAIIFMQSVICLFIEWCSLVCFISVVCLRYVDLPVLLYAAGALHGLYEEH